MQQLRNYIDGQLVAPLGGQYLDNIDPSTGKVYSAVPDSDERDVAQAAAAAERAFPVWSRMPAVERSRILLKIADLVESNLERLALAECVDNGKPLTVARSLDIPRAVTNFRFFGSSILHFASESHVTDDVALNYTLRKPRGVCGIISPWNLPLYLFTWKVAPALSVGNTVVAKPSEVTPMTAYLFSDLCREAGLPPGVLNIVHGLGRKAGAAIVSHPSVNTLSFTGGTVTGREIAKAAAPMFKKVALEMGGKNPTVVFGDVNLDEVVGGTLRASFANQGQICLCGSRVLVEQGIYEQFVDKFIAGARKLRVGDPLEASTEQGAVVSKAQLEKSLYYVNLAREEGGRIRCGGSAPPPISERCCEGYFLEPTVITDLPPGCRTNREEIFGAVASIQPFRDEEEAVESANATDYGLSASVWTQNVQRAHRLADRINAGTVWVNCWLVRDLRVPFGGMKQSGVGREGGLEALRFFTEPKNVCVKL